MPRYYFDVYEGDKVTVDADGIQFGSAAIAWTEAARSVAEMARDAFPQHADDITHSLKIEVRDESGLAFSVKADFVTERKP